MPARMRFFVALLLLGFAACTQAGGNSRPGLKPVAVTATAVPLDGRDPARAEVGRLRYLGGIELKSDDNRFGGLSGLRAVGPAELLAVTDGGHWVQLRLREEGEGLVGLEAAAIDVIRGPRREPLKGKAHVDAEALEHGPQGASVAFERDHRIWHYRDLEAPARSESFPDERWLAALPGNDGIEAMAKVGDAWLYVAEADMPGGHEGVLIVPGGLNRAYARVKVEMPAPYKPTDAVALTDDKVLILARRFSPLAGVGAALLVADVDAKNLKLGKPTLLAELAPPLSVDNMEGLALSREGGRTFLYLASDDNFSPLQRTLVLKFELLP
jgi:hypothetical protein